MKTAIEKVTWVGRITVFAVGLAVVLALTVGLATTALATFPGDSGRIAFASNRTTGEGVVNPEGDFETFTMNRDGTGLTQLTENAAFDFDPEWSADGERIAFNSNRDGNFEIYEMNADGTEQLNLTNDPAGDFTPDWQPVKRRY